MVNNQNNNIGLSQLQQQLWSIIVNLNNNNNNNNNNNAIIETKFLKKA